MPEVNCRNRTKTENRSLSFMSFIGLYKMIHGGWIIIKGIGEVLQ